MTTSREAVSLSLSPSFTKFSLNFIKRKVFTAFIKKNPDNCPSPVTYKSGTKIFSHIYLTLPFQRNLSIYVKHFYKTQNVYTVSVLCKPTQAVRDCIKWSMSMFLTTRLGVTDTRERATSHQIWLSLPFKLNIFTIYGDNICNKIWCPNF